MTSEALYNLRYPIGEFEKPNHITSTMINSWIDTIEVFPEAIEKIISPLTSETIFRYSHHLNGITQTIVYIIK